MISGVGNGRFPPNFHLQTHPLNKALSGIKQKVCSKN